MSDFYSDSARRRLEQIDAERAAALADLAAHRSNSDYDSAAQTVQSLANLDAERQNLARLYSDYVAAQTPAAQPELTSEEKHAKPWSKMDWNDVVDLARGSRYAKNIRPDDPNMVAGYHETRRRSARGE